jgi:hypothetical protein
LPLPAIEPLGQFVCPLQSSIVVPITAIETLHNVAGSIVLVLEREDPSGSLKGSLLCAKGLAAHMVNLSIHFYLGELYPSYRSSKHQ